MIVMTFSVLCSPAAGENDYVTDFEYDSSRRFGKAPMCPACGKATGKREWLLPHKVWIRCWGQSAGDLAFFGSTILVSERFVKLFTTERLVGFQFDGEATVTKVVPHRLTDHLPTYHVAFPVRSDARADHTASETEFESGPICPICLTGRILVRHTRIVLVEGTWRGEDVFVPIGFPGTILVSERFIDFCAEHRFTNLKLVKASDYCVDFT